MAFNFSKAILLFTISLALVFAVPLQMLKPTSMQIAGGESINLGTIGPGQTVTLELNPKVTEGGVNGIGGRYDIAWAESMPEGWKSADSKLYGEPLQVSITAAQDAEEGDYRAMIVVGDEDDGERLGNISFAVKVTVDRDIMESKVTPTSISTGPSQPARYYITIENKGTASDVFEISTKGVERWKFKKFVYMPAKSSKTVFYEIAEDEEEFYSPVIQVVSTSSSIIRNEHPVEFRVTSDLATDFKATNNGIMLFPIFESAIYSFAGLISNFLG